MASRGKTAELRPGEAVAAPEVVEGSEDIALRAAPPTISKNMLALFASQGATWLIGAVMLVIAPRYLGDLDFGRFSFATTYLGIFGLLGMLGTSTYLVKHTARDPSTVGVYVLNALYLKAVLGVGLSVAALGLGVLLGYEPVLLQLLFAACLTMTFSLLNDVATAGLQGMERMARPAAWSTLAQYCAAGFGLIAIALDGGVVAYAFALVPAGLVPIAANLRDLRPHLPRLWRPDLRLWKEIGLGGMPYLAWSAILLIYGSADILMLRPMAGEATVGWYALAYKWVSIPTGIAATVLVALLPSLSASGIDVSSEFCRRANRALKLVTFVGFPVAVGIALVATDVLGLLYSGEFDRSVPLLRILALSIPLVLIDMMLGMVLIASDRQRQWVLVGCVAAVLNPALNFVAIPLTIGWYGNGAIGAAAVTVLTEFVMMLGAILLKPRGVLDRATLAYVGRCVVTVALMALTVVILGGTPLPVKIAGGATAYVVASWILRTVSREDLDLIRLQLRPGRT